MMKKFVCIALALISGFVLTGCKSQAVRTTERQISSIGEVTMESGSVIGEAESSYAVLSSEEQETVENYQTLTDARSTYEKMALDSFVNAIETGDYETGNEIAEKLDDTTLADIGYAMIAYGTDQAYGHLWYYEGNDEYIDDAAISKISGIVDCAKAIGSRMNIPEDNEFSPVMEFLQVFHDYMNNEIQYFDLAILHSKTSGLAYPMSDFVDALNSGSRTQLYSSFYEIQDFKYQLDYPGTNEFAIQYVDSVNEFYNGALKIISSIETGNSSLFDSGLAELKKGAEPQADLGRLAASSLEKNLVLLDKCDDINDTLKKWNPTSESESRES